LGKALADPARGVTALYRAGIPLDKQLEARVKALAKAGQVEQARALLLQNVAGQTKGLAAAVADPMTRLQTNINNVLESLGTPFLTAIGTISSSLSAMFNEVSPMLTQMANQLGPLIASAVKQALPYIVQLVSMFIGLLKTALRLKDTVWLVGKILAVVWASQKISAGLMVTIKGIQLLTKAYRLLRVEGLKAVVIQAIATRGKSLAVGAAAATAALAGWAILENQVNNTLGKMPDLTAGLTDNAMAFSDAAVALNVGAKNAASAAKAVGSATGKKTAKVKPKTAVTPRTKTAANQSFTVAGTGGGISMSVTINGSVVQERDVARTIRDELMQFARRQGVTPVFGV